MKSDLMTKRGDWYVLSGEYVHGNGVSPMEAVRCALLALKRDLKDCYRHVHVSQTLLDHDLVDPEELQRDGTVEAEHVAEMLRSASSRIWGTAYALGELHEDLADLVKDEHPVPEAVSDEEWAELGRDLAALDPDRRLKVFGQLRQHADRLRETRDAERESRRAAFEHIRSVMAPAEAEAS